MLIYLVKSHEHGDEHVVADDLVDAVHVWVGLKHDDYQEWKRGLSPPERAICDPAEFGDPDSVRFICEARPSRTAHRDD